ncbi:MAG: histidine phosphatase family protein [Nitriliruptorales bacterium]|nr:histidine phosphatase family protein [Nitriliruptorales bacterium]
MKRLVLIRHGQSAWNVERRVQGQSGTGLTDVGREQAKAVAVRIADQYPGAPAWTSDLQRCEETVESIEDALGVTATRHVGLRERDFGSWTGQLVTEIAENDTERFQRWANGEDVIGEVGGESSQVLGDRVEDTLEHILGELAEGGTAVVVTHGGPVWHGTHRWVDLAEPSLGGVANCSITELVEWEQRRFCDQWNGTGHLAPELVTTRKAAEKPRQRAQEPDVGA